MGRAGRGRESVSGYEVKRLPEIVGDSNRYAQLLPTGSGATGWLDTDDDAPNLTASFSPTEVEEGGTMTLTVESTAGAFAEDTLVTLTFDLGRPRPRPMNIG